MGINKLAKFGVAALAAAGLSAGFASTASAQIIAQPGETMGLAFGAPLPVGVYGVDTESYGQRDGQNSRLGVNIPVIAWSTPWTFLDSRVEVLYAAPFTHIDGGGAPGRVDFYSNYLAIALAHDFGNGWNAAVYAGPRTEDNFTNNGRGVAADLRFAISYVKDGWNLTAALHYEGDFGGKVSTLSYNGVGFNDNMFIDYTATKKFGKFEIGVVGTAYTDISGPSSIRAGGVAVGGLLGYDFGKFTVQGMVTREVAVRNGGYGLGLGLPGATGGRETRGWLRVIVPLYVAPTAPAPVVARY